MSTLESRASFSYKNLQILENDVRSVVGNSSGKDLRAIESTPSRSERWRLSATTESGIFGGAFLGLSFGLLGVFAGAALGGLAGEIADRWVRARQRG